MRGHLELVGGEKARGEWWLNGRKTGKKKVW
jgi:hypothetical protein